MSRPLALLLFAGLPLACLPACGGGGGAGGHGGAGGEGSEGGASGVGGEGGATGGSTGGAPWVELGTGSDAFEPLTAGQEVPIIMGPQGGYHVWGALQAGGLEPKGVTMHFELAQGDRLVGEATALDDLYRATPSSPYGYTRVAVVLLANDPAALAPGTALLRLTLTTTEGAVLNDEVEITPVCCQ